MPHSQADLNQSRSLPQPSAHLRTDTNTARPEARCGAMRGRSLFGVTQIVTQPADDRDAQVTQPAWEWLIWLNDKEVA